VMSDVFPDRPRPARSKWLLRTPGDAPARLFCFPYSGTGASMYQRWPRRIGPVEVCPLQPPGRENRIGEEHYGTYQALTDSLLAILPPYLDRPFAFFGHCGGALPGVEATLRLAAAGLPTPARVFVSSQVAPHDGPYGRFLGLTEKELTSELEKLIVQLGGRPSPSLIELSLEVLGNDIDANRRYHYASPPRLSSGITVIGWSHDREVPPDVMGGWSACSDDVRYVTLPGEHYDFLFAPPALFDEIAYDMERALTTGQGRRSATVASPSGTPRPVHASHPGSAR
jgi:surfactin synthase thioesterase subunit